MTIQELRELPEETLVNMTRTEYGTDYDNVISVLKEKGYRLCGFHWTKDDNEVDPVDAMFEKVYNNK